MPPAQRSDTPPRMVKPRSTGDWVPLKDMVRWPDTPVRLDDRRGRSARAFDDDGLAEEVDPLVVGSGPDAHRVTRSCRIDGRLDRRIDLRDEKTLDAVIGFGAVSPSTPAHTETVITSRQPLDLLVMSLSSWRTLAGLGIRCARRRGTLRREKRVKVMYER